MELREGFEVVHESLVDDGVLTFTYHHSDSESWGELLESLCDVGFEVTATYPITADLHKFISGEAVSFDIVVVARPIDDTEPASWNSLRRDIYRTARRTRTQLEENRDLSRGDIGVMEMGACFHEYSKHHGKVQRDGEIMSAKEVVQEIYGIIQEASDIGVEDVFIDLLDTSTPPSTTLTSSAAGRMPTQRTSRRPTCTTKMTASNSALGTTRSVGRTSKSGSTAKVATTFRPRQTSVPPLPLREGESSSELRR